MEAYLKDIHANAGRIRDPLYGFIPLTEEEMKIIDTPLFQRLRRVHQLALTKYVYPSAEHSRFVHSLGVMHCATQILAGVMEHRETNISAKPTEKAIRMLRYAALLHDIGHLPFSHAVESQWLQGLKHEDVSMFIIEHYKPIADIINQDPFRVDCKDVAALLGKMPKARYQLYHEIVSGQLDADRADYLLRDSHCCGTRYGEYDFPRFLRIFAAREDDNGTLSLCIDEKDLPVAESLLIARYHYNLQIPYHRTRSGYDYALKKFAREHVDFRNVFSIQENKLVDMDFDRFAVLDDGTLFEKIKEKYLERDEWAQCLLRQSHLCPVLDTTSQSREGVERFKKLVTDLRADRSLEEDTDFFVQEQTIEMIKRAKPADECAESDAPLPTGIRLLVREGERGEKKAVDIAERSWIFAQLKDTHKVYRVYAFPSKKNNISTYLS